MGDFGRRSYYYCTMQSRTTRGQRLCKTVTLPAAAAGLFSKHMLAVLGAIRDMADDQGRCTATDARIAQFAGVSRGSMHVAIKRAQSIGLIAVEHRPRRGKRVITNKAIGR